jgi:hypothetical protein
MATKMGMARKKLEIAKDKHPADPVFDEHDDECQK